MQNIQYISKIKLKNSVYLLLSLFIGLSAKSQWIVKSLPLTSTENLYGISFINDTTAKIVSNTQIVHCTNNFNSFNPDNINYTVGGMPGTIITAKLRDVYFLSGNSGFTTGQFNLLNDFILLGSNDGGGTFNGNYLSNTGNAPRYFTSVDMYGMLGIACGSQGRIIRSSSAGTTWTEVSSGTTNTLNDIAYINSTNIIAVGDYRILRSSNSGSSWTADASYSTEVFKNISLTNNNTTAYICSDTKIFKSINSGSTFSTITTPFLNINCIKAKSNDTVFIGTNNGIFVSANSGTTWEQFIDTKNYSVNKIEIRAGKIYALCNSATLLINGINNLAPDPFANFNINQVQACDSTIMQCQNASNLNYSYKWYLNNNLVSNNYNYNKTFYTTTGNSEAIKLVVKNGLKLDSITKSTIITLKTSPIANIGNDIYDCFGQSVSVSNIGAPTSGQTYTWLPTSAYTSVTYTTSAITQPLTSNTQLILRTKNITSGCIKSDTVNIFIDAKIDETYHPTYPNTTNFCSNANCNTFTSLSFVTKKIGYGIAQTGQVIKTIDGATTWTTSSVALSLPQTIRDIQFIDPNIGYIADGFKTINGGNTWTTFTVNGFFGNLSFVNKDTGIVAFSISSSSPSYSRIYMTKDGANNFTKIYDYQTHGYMFIADVKMANTNTIYIAGSTNDLNTPPIFKKTINGGLSWTTYTVPVTICIDELAVINTDTIFGITSRNDVIKSTDGGVTWSKYKIVSTTSQVINSIKMVNSTIGYAGCNNGSLYKTINGGNCWTKVSTATNYNNVTAIGISPNSDAVFYAASNVFSNFKPEVYATQFYRNLAVTIDSNWCAGNNINTHNLSTGFTSYKWFLNNNPYSINRDTTFRFNSAGQHTITLQADSMGVGMQSVSFTLNITPSLGSVGVISGNQYICTSSLNSLTLTASSNTAATNFYWSTDNPTKLTTGWNASNNDTLYPLFGFSTSSAIVNIFVYGKDDKGCLTTDTAKHTVKTRGGPPTVSPTVFNVNTRCFTFDTLNFNSFVPQNIITVSTTTNNGADSYTYIDNHYTFNYTVFTPTANIGIPEYCHADSTIINLYYSNVCGLSPNSKTNYYLTTYNNYNTTITPDTVVLPGANIKLRCKISFNSSIDNYCYNLINSGATWSFRGNYLNYGVNSITKNNVTAADTGMYSIRLKNGCNFIQKNIHVTFPVITNDYIHSIISNIDIYPNPSKDFFSITNPNNLKMDYTLYNNLGQIIYVTDSDKSQTIDASNLSEGTYHLKISTNMFTTYKKLTVLKE
jgi:photosystem II stability/assembly factor-like uncharacterized protein